MPAIKAAILLLFAAFGLAACFAGKEKGISIVESKRYEASLFRQNCAICHGAEGHGRTLDDGTQVPSLREGEFKMTTELLIRKQISDGGNGMPPFRGQLTEREINLMTDFVYKDLRGN
jgi:mono/diheme cytochrome c family protein